MHNCYIKAKAKAKAEEEKKILLNCCIVALLNDILNSALFCTWNFGNKYCPDSPQAMPILMRPSQKPAPFLPA